MTHLILNSLDIHSLNESLIFDLLRLSDILSLNNSPKFDFLGHPLVMKVEGYEHGSNLLKQNNK